MARELTGEARAAIARILGNNFKFDDFDTLTHACWKDRVINEFTNEKRPTIQMARDILEQAEHFGLLDTFLFLCVTAKPKELTDLIRRLRPGALTPVFTLSAQIQNVAKALRGFLADAETRGVIAKSTQLLKELIPSIDELTTYKRLHDTLHQVLLASVPALCDAAAKFANDETAREYLEDYLKRLQTALISAQQLHLTLDDPSAKRIEAQWIGRIDKYTKDLESGLATANAPAVRWAAIRTAHVAESHANRLNDCIVATAESLPLNQLADVIAQITPESNLHAAIDPSVAAIDNLRGLLTARVNIHNRLQEVQFDLSIFGSRLANDERDVLADFARTWPGIRSTVSDVVGLHVDLQYPQAPKEIGDAALAVEDQVLLIDQAEAVGSDDRARAMIKSLSRTFKSFRNTVVLYFYRVDKSLLSDLEDLSGISESLQPLLIEA